MSTDTIDEISHADLRAGLEHGGSLLLLDVLPRASYELGHIPGAVNLPLHEIEARADALLADKDRQITAYCAGYD